MWREDAPRTGRLEDLRRLDPPLDDATAVVRIELVVDARHPVLTEPDTSAGLVAREHRDEGDLCEVAHQLAMLLRREPRIGRSPCPRMHGYGFEDRSVVVVPRTEL